MISMKKTVLGTALAMAFSAGAAQAAAVYTPVVTTFGNNFTMVSASNGLTGGTNDVKFTWDGSYRTAVVTAANTANGLNYNAQLTSLTPFSGKVWTAHHVNIYGEGTYTFDSSCTSATAACTPGGSVNGKYTMTVGAGQVGAHMLFNWSTSTNIDVVLLFDVNKSWAQTGTTSAFCAGLGADCNATPGNTINTVWSAVSIDTPASIVTALAAADETNNYSGTKMIDGPFVGQSANFNLMGLTAQNPPVSSVPVPAAAWLLGSGLLGLVGVARRKQVA